MPNENQTQVEENIEVVDTAIAESEAMNTLKPTADKTKSGMLAHMMKYFAGMKKEDLSKYMNDVLAQVGKEDESGLDTSAANKASVSMKEDVQGLFTGQDLSEEFVSEATTLFEAAVNNRITIEVARLEEEAEQKLEEQVTEALDELHEQVSMYMDYVVEKFMEDNEVAIENNFRSEIAESFIDGLKNLFKESYIEVPEEKVDLVGELQEAVEKLQEQLESVESENIRLNKTISEAIQEATFDDVAEGLVDTQVEKLRSLSEGIEFDSIEEYEQKLNIIKNRYFSEETETESSTGLILEEEGVGLNEEPEQTMVIPDEMKSYFNAISKTIKK